MDEYESFDDYDFSEDEPPLPTPAPQPHVAPEEVQAMINQSRLAGQEGARQALNDHMMEQQRQDRLRDIEKRVVSNFPDLNDRNSDMFEGTAYYLRTVYGGNTEFAEEAAMRAAQDIGIRPKLGRRLMQQEPQLEKQVPHTKLTKRQIEVARRFGQDPKDLAKYTDENYGG